jgi:hypothetical protein
MCQGKWCCEGKVTDLKETKTCTGSESADGVAAHGSKEYSENMQIRVVWHGVAAHGSKEYSENMQIRVVWQSADGSVADQLEGEKFHILSEF